MKNLFRGTALSLILATALSSAAEAKEMVDMDIAVLRTIDKVSAYTHTFEVPVGKTVKFGSSLFIKVRACRKASPMESPEDASFLQIWQHKKEDAKPSWVFSGWMFASNPSISGVEHPVYDVWVIECKNERTSKSDESFTSEEPTGGVSLDSEKPAEEKPETPAPAAPSSPEPAKEAPKPAAEEANPSASAPAASPVDKSKEDAATAAGEKAGDEEGE